MSTKISEIKPIVYSCNGKTLTFIKPLVMAIVNVTPDSFYDGGKFDSVSDILNDVEQKIFQGADIIDLGAASSRPGAMEIDLNEEWKRLEPVLKALRNAFPDTILSVDTYRSEIAKRSAAYGADMINDIAGGSLDENMLDVVSGLNLPYVLMHIQGTPKSMQQNPVYSNVVEEVRQSLNEKILVLHSKGFSKIIIDPGFGFGKNLEDNYKLLKSLPVMNDHGLPILAGVSRKSMINKVINTNPVTALNGSTVLHTIALMNNASILRVHDVNEARQAIELVQYYKNV